MILQTSLIVAAVGVLLRPFYKGAGFMLQVRDEWEDIRERMRLLEELTSNGGSTIKDKVQRMEIVQAKIAEDQGELTRVVTQMATYFEGAVDPPQIERKVG